MAARLLTKSLPVSAGATSRPALICWSSSVYPARKTPISGLDGYRSQIPSTSANLRLFLKWTRNARVSAAAREKLHTLERMIVQEASEKAPSRPRTIRAVGPAWRNS